MSAGGQFWKELHLNHYLFMCFSATFITSALKSSYYLKNFLLLLSIGGVSSPPGVRASRGVHGCDLRPAVGYTET